MHSPDRVRDHTPEEINARIDAATEACIRAYADRGRDEITTRICELEREWDIERWLEMNAAGLALGGLLLGMTKSRAWLLLPGIVLPFLLQHAVQGWCPPVAVLRRRGIRTRQEIDREIYALRALRGDFEAVTTTLGAEEAIRSTRR